MRLTHIRRVRTSSDCGTLRRREYRISMVGYAPPIAHPPLVDFTWLFEPTTTRRFPGLLMISVLLNILVFRALGIPGF